MFVSVSQSHHFSGSPAIWEAERDHLAHLATIWSHLPKDTRVVTGCPLSGDTRVVSPF